MSQPAPTTPAEEEKWQIPPAPEAHELPQRLLYTTSARLGGSGLDVSSLEGARTAYRGGFLSKVIAFANQQDEIPSKLVRSLAWHPVRLLSGLGSEHYYAAKKHYVDWIASGALAKGGFDFLHSWSGDALRSLVVARQNGIPTVLDIPTWHRNKGVVKKFYTRSEKELERLSGWAALKNGLLTSRQHQLLEYSLATVLHMPSTRAAETFLAAGIPAERLHLVGRGVNVQQFQPAEPPGKFRAIFVGALIQRKGVHLLLQAWKKLALKDAELVLVGSIHPEIEPYLQEAPDTVVVKGFVKNVADELRQSSVFVFPSELEGAAKVTFEAAACGLAQITTRESGDAVQHGLNGWIIPPNDADALADAIREAYQNPAKLVELGKAGRQRMEAQFSWDHFRRRVAAGYAKAKRLAAR
jgi:glycosyltransferase involved in cell wall biosynthesis